LNIDYIASASKLSALLTEPVAEWTARFDWNVETPVRNEIISRVIGQIGVSSLVGSLGGSAWNVIFALAHMQVNLRLGYVGVVGRAEYPGLSFLSQMDSWGIDRRFVLQNPADSCGLCLSYIEDGCCPALTMPTKASLWMPRFGA
jgi:sugar/nucleoside kinase (ribokinase family)